MGLAALAGGCGGGGGSTTISSQPLSGMIDGQPWTFMTGETNSSLSTASQYWVDAYAESFTPCTGNASSTADELLLSLPTAAGDFRSPRNSPKPSIIPPRRTTTSAPAAVQINVTAVTATTITGGARFAYDANNSVDGQFEVTICP